MTAQHLPVERPFELGLMFTHRCPIACRHCGILSGPDNHEAMPAGMAESAIAQAARLTPRPSTIVFTGGEAMMFPQRLEQLLGMAHDHGFATRVVTNGFWGRNADHGRQLLYRLQLAGLDSLNFSADKYHLEFMPAETFRHAVQAARDVGFPIIVNLVLNAPGDPIAAFCGLYGYAPDEVRLFDEDAFLAQRAVAAVPQDLLEKINLSFGRLIGMGRAAEYPEEHYLTGIDEFCRMPCHEVSNRPVIYPDGSLQACCCAGGKIAAFTVGNVNERPLADLVAEMNARSHFHFIQRFGPRVLHEAMAEMLPDRSLAGPHASICDICVGATRGLDPHQIDTILEHWVLKRFVHDYPATPDQKERTFSNL